MDDFAQTREDDDLFESEISAPVLPPPTAPTEPRAFTNRSGRERGRGFYQARGDREKSAPAEGVASTAGTEATQKKDIDRTLSGDELAARLERVKLNNQRLIERRRKAEEDESSFQVAEEARKQADVHKRLADRKKRAEADRNRKELDDEREKNRQRKLNAVQTREWDSTKTEEDYNPRSRSSGFRRGAHGGVATATPPRGAPSGPRAGVGSPARATVEAVSAQEWPELPGGKLKGRAKGPKGEAKKGELKNDEEVKQEEGGVKSETNEDQRKNPTIDTTAAKGKPALLSPTTGGSSWAEQVEAGSPVVTTTAATAT
ncbi:unnamed protein product [Tuber melanosporum]|uniref:(Perigord truffle) hypothetical protein n=1 Tax=Tuber melanosporum (strain Mel28) TaxID=656061 RepID=D5GD28_TUBMM|nr:uncharacterized protein GSTUM_00000916001 [Tuber melanosporum]CAZ82421.1 unnamed protein product [Tuber melanosporum]